jgi:thymidylate synthase (FAD)
MEVALLSITPAAEKHIERCTRICYDSLDKLTATSHQQFLPSILKRGHVSPLSFAHATFKVTGISRVCSHQLVRHAHLRYLQRSQRYCGEDKIDYVEPESVRSIPRGMFYGIMCTLWSGYKQLKWYGLKNEDARMVLPSACVTEMCVAGNLQAWWDFLRLRLGTHTQLETRTVAKHIYQELNCECPNIFNQENLLLQPKLNLDFGETE